MGESVAADARRHIAKQSPMVVFVSSAVRSEQLPSSAIQVHVAKVVCVANAVHVPDDARQRQATLAAQIF